MWRTFGAKWLIFRSSFPASANGGDKVLSVWDKLYKHGTAVRQACRISEPDDETVVYALVQWLAITDWWSFVDQLLTRIETMRLSNQVHRGDVEERFLVIRVLDYDHKIRVSVPGLSDASYS